MPMTPEQITQQIEGYQMMQYANMILLCIVGFVVSIAAWYFKRDADSNREIIRQNSIDINEALAKIDLNQTVTERILRILANHTGANIGL